MGLTIWVYDSSKKATQEQTLSLKCQTKTRTHSISDDTDIGHALNSRLRPFSLLKSKEHHHHHISCGLQCFISMQIQQIIVEPKIIINIGTPCTFKEYVVKAAIQAAF